MRDLGVYMADPDRDPAHEDMLVEVAFDVCTKCRELLGDFLGLDKHDLHCCLKVMLPADEPAESDRVATLARSNPLDDKPCGLNDAHPVEKNSVWSALLERNDGKTGWNRFNCFSCNHLHQHKSVFRCSREAWWDYYNSVLVYLLRYPVLHSPDHNYVGFLAFDSPRAGVFHGLPDVFEYCSDVSGYRNALTKSAVFHLGAVCADALSTFLLNAYEKNHGGST